MRDRLGDLTTIGLPCPPRYTDDIEISGDEILIDLKQCEVWFLTGTQPLYSPKPLETVAEHSRELAAALGASAHNMRVASDQKPGNEK